MVRIPGTPVPPLPAPIPGGLLGKVGTKVLKIVQKLFGLFTGKAKEVGELEPGNSVDDVEKVFRIFNEIKSKMHENAVAIEAVVDEEIKAYIDDLIILLDDSEEKVALYGINIDRIIRKINKISSKANGVIDNEMSKKVSLDNLECRKIVQMVPGVNKENAIKQFIEQVVKEALSAGWQEVDSLLGEIFEETEEEILGAIDESKRHVEQIKNSFSLIDAENFAHKSEEEMGKASYLYDICSVLKDVV